MNKLLLGAAVIICIIVAGVAYLNKGDNMQNFAKTDADFTAIWNHFRELITFAVLVSMGGADAQAKAHAQANINVGNDRQVLLRAPALYRLPAFT